MNDFLRFFIYLLFINNYKKSGSNTPLGDFYRPLKCIDYSVRLDVIDQIGAFL